MITLEALRKEIMSNEIYHHVVKGMKWGVWNDETRARYEGTSPRIPNEKTAAKIQKLDDRKAKAQLELDDIKKYGYKSTALIKRYPGIDTMSDFDFEFGYGIRKKDAATYTGRTLRNKVVRCDYRKKLLTGEKFTDEEKKLIKQDAIKTAVIVAAATGVGVYAAYKFGVFEKMHNNNAALTSIAEQSLSAGDYEQVIKQGFDFHRMSGWKHEDFSSRAAILVSATEADRDIYKGFLRDWHHTGKRYESTLRAAKDITVAGSEKQHEILRDLLEDNDYFDEFAQRFVGSTRAAKRERALLGAEKFSERYYDKVIYDLVKQDSAPAKRYLEKAKNLGYGALVDDFDRGTMSYTPLILLDPSSVVEQVGSTRVRLIDQGIAQYKTGARGIMATYSGFKLPDKAKG